LTFTVASLKVANRAAFAGAAPISGALAAVLLCRWCR
jgi:hypothetical protein